MYNCIVIDDELLARQRISSFISKQKDWRIIGEASAFAEAQALISKHQPDVCFMDINIIGGNGIELAKHLGKTIACHWVFTTACNDYAIDAFDMAATDYLLKPFDNSRLANVLRKIEKPPLRNKSEYKTLLAVKSVSSVEFVNVNELIWIKGSANYVELHFADRMVLHRKTLTDLETQLDPKRFARVHRSAIVKIDRVNSLSSELGRFSLLHMSNGNEVRISESHKASLFELLGLEN